MTIASKNKMLERLVENSRKCVSVVHIKYTNNADWRSWSLCNPTINSHTPAIVDHFDYLGLSLSKDADDLNAVESTEDRKSTECSSKEMFIILIYHMLCYAFLFLLKSIAVMLDSISGTK